MRFTAATVNANPSRILWIRGGNDPRDIRHCGRCGRAVKNRGWGSHRVACDRKAAP